MKSDLNKIEAAFLRRERFIKELRDAGTNAFRAFGGKKEGIPGLIIDVYDRIAILNLYEGLFKGTEDENLLLFDKAKCLYGVERAFVKKFERDRSRSVIEGANQGLALEFQENHHRFEIHPDDGLSVGLFLDQRENRKQVGTLSKDRRLLNLFSYTCGFSIYAATEGATTVNVDTSRKYLEWGKRNFQLNGISPEKHRFVIEGVKEYLKRLVKRGERFDVVVLDPPTFGRSIDSIFSIEKDFFPVLELVLEVLDPFGVLLLSCNFQKWTNKDLVKKLETVFSKLNRKFGVINVPTPFDFIYDENPLASALIQCKVY